MRSAARTGSLTKHAVVAVYRRGFERNLKEVEPVVAVRGAERHAFARLIGHRLTRERPFVRVYREAADGGSAHTERGARDAFRVEELVAVLVGYREVRGID